MDGPVFGTSIDHKILRRLRDESGTIQQQTSTANDRRKQQLNGKRSRSARGDVDEEEDEDNNDDEEEEEDSEEDAALPGTCDWVVIPSGLGALTCTASANGNVLDSALLG